MKTKSLAVALSLVLVLGMAGCGGQQAQQEPQDPDQGKVQQSEPASTTPPVESMEVNNENDTAKPLTELEDIEPKEAGGAGIFEGSGSVEVELFTEVNETVYATGTVNLRSGPSTAHDKVGSLNKSDSVTRVGIGTADAEGWSRIQLSDGSIVYVSNKYLSTTKPVAQQPSGGSTQGKPSGQTQQQETSQQPITPQQPADSSGLTPEEQAIRDKFLKDNEEAKANGWSVGEGDPLTDEDIEGIGSILNGG